MSTTSSLALRESRALFRAFYAKATLEDAAAMDVLVTAYISVTLGILLPRKHVAEQHRMRIERDCDQAEREFMVARDQVRACSTFCNLPPADQKRVASLFEIFMPTE